MQFFRVSYQALKLEENMNKGGVECKNYLLY